MSRYSRKSGINQIIETMSRIKNISTFRDAFKHINDDYRNQGYDYERHILQNVISPELFANPLNDTPLRQIERLIEYLINSVRQIKLTYAIAFPKNAKNIN